MYLFLHFFLQIIVALHEITQIVTFFLFQLLLKISASDVFHGKKSCYLASVSKPFVTSHLCE